MFFDLNGSNNHSIVSFRNAGWPQAVGSMICWWWKTVIANVGSSRCVWRCCHQPNNDSSRHNDRHLWPFHSIIGGKQLDCRLHDEKDKDSRDSWSSTDNADVWYYFSRPHSIRFDNRHYCDRSLHGIVTGPSATQDCRWLSRVKNWCRHSRKIIHSNLSLLLFLWLWVRHNSF